MRCSSISRSWSKKITGPGPAPSAAGAVRCEAWRVAAWALVFLAVAGAVQWHTRVPWDMDTAYHAAVGRLIREHGILHAFPWTPFSWLSDHYADKELLFHLLFVPFTGLGWITSSKIVGALCGACVLLALYVVLRQERVPFPGLWALLPLATSSVFVFRFALVRPHLLSIALALLVPWAAARGRLVILAAVAAVYPWAYVAWQLPVVLVLVAEVARLAAGKGIRWEPLAAVLLGAAVGILLHPNRSNLIALNMLQIGEVLFRNAWGGKENLDLGREFAPFTLDQWLRWLSAAVSMTVAALVLAWRSRKSDDTPLSFALAALGFGVLTVATARFAEYFVPFSVAAVAVASWRFTSGMVRSWIVPAGLLVVTAVYTVAPTAATLRGIATREDEVPPELALWLQQQIPAGSQVFTCEAGTTGTLMLALPERRFMVALDPTFFLVRDPELYHLWYRLPMDAPRDAVATIRERFGARYVICAADDTLHMRFFTRLSTTPGVRVLFASDLWIVIDLGGSAG